MNQHRMNQHRKPKDITPEDWDLVVDSLHEDHCLNALVNGNIRGFDDTDPHSIEGIIPLVIAEPADFEPLQNGKRLRISHPQPILENIKSVFRSHTPKPATVIDRFKSAFVAKSTTKFYDKVKVVKELMLVLLHNVDYDEAKLYSCLSLRKFMTKCSEGDPEFKVEDYKNLPEEMKWAIDHMASVLHGLEGHSFSDETSKRVIFLCLFLAFSATATRHLFYHKTGLTLDEDNILFVITIQSSESKVLESLKHVLFVFDDFDKRAVRFLKAVLDRDSFWYLDIGQDSAMDQHYKTIDSVVLNMVGNGITPLYMPHDPVSMHVVAEWRAWHLWLRTQKNKKKTPRAGDSTPATATMATETTPGSTLTTATNLGASTGVSAIETPVHPRTISFANQQLVGAAGTMIDSESVEFTNEQLVDNMELDETELKFQLSDVFQKFKNGNTSERMRIKDVITNLLTN